MNKVEQATNELMEDIKLLDKVYRDYLWERLSKAISPEVTSSPSVS